MQYILSQEEFDALKKTKSDINQAEKVKLQRLCTKIANEMPIVWGWGETDPKPWGCFITKDDEEWFCDDCPVLSICPKDWKSFSK